MERIFHKEIGLPPELDKYIGRIFKLTFSQHAKDECRNDRYGFIIPPQEVLITKDNVIEVEMHYHNIVKILVRMPYDSVNDISIAFIPSSHGGFVKTLWLNRKTDVHRTLDRSKYDSPVAA
jgi:hypothetical protein